MAHSSHPSGIASGETSSLTSDRTFRLMVNQIRDYAIFLLNPNGEIVTWSPGAQRLKGYSADEITGKHFRIFYPPGHQSLKIPENELIIAADTGRFEDEGWRIRKNGERFWASIVISAIRDTDGRLLGYGKVVRDLTDRKRAEDKVRDISTRLLKMQEHERGRIGRELHDSVGQYLIAIKMTLNGLIAQYQHHEKLAIQLVECLPMVNRAIQEIRTLSYLLYPPMLKDLGLSYAIRLHLDGFSERSGISVTCERCDAVRLPPDVELALFRVFQESLSNVHRHSQSPTVQISFAVQDGHASLEIKDQGKGMPRHKRRNEPLTNRGVGVRGMQDRIEEVGGRLEISSDAGGTTVIAEVPVPSVLDTEQGP